MKGELIAWDPVAQKQVWSVPLATPWNGGALSTAGGLVFEGNGEGFLVAYRADTGERLWSKFLGSGIVAPPITYTVRGVQYVAVAVGWGGILPLNLGEVLKKGVPPRVNRIVAFRLDGAAAMPLPAAETAAFDPPPSTAAAAVIDQGRAYFHASCWMCHGESAVNNGGVPNLRRSPVIASAAAFRSFVLGGAAESLGMPNFGRDYTPAQAEAIRAYLIKRANDLKADPSQP
jgi:mono/diheme cytochrome c family protein